MRLFQMELRRRRGLGLLSEVFGDRYLDLDVAARTFLSRGALDREFAAYPARDHDRLEAFVAGINAWIAEVNGDETQLPPEFEVFGFRPARWTGEDLLRIRIHRLSSNAEEEVARTLTLLRHGPAVERMRRLLEPEPKVLGAPEFDAAVIDDSLLAVYRAARESLVFGNVSTRRSTATPTAATTGIFREPTRAAAGRSSRAIRTGS